MYLPLAEPRSSVFYQYRIHPYRRAPEMDGGRSNAPVVIAGAGPIGMATAIDLARFGVPTIVLEQELQVSHGSRATALTRRSVEILQQIGVAERFIAKGLPWQLGRSYFRGQEVYQMVLPHDENDRFLPCLNLEQQYMEEYLVEACEANPLIDLRWGQKVIGASQDNAGVTLRLDTPDGEYDLIVDWVVAADGGRSVLRKIFDLQMEGRSYAGSFVIADIKANIDLPTERLCFFEPDWNPGSNVLIHRQPDGIWRVDFRLPDNETVAQALEPQQLAPRINAVLEMLHQKTEWQLDWTAVYSASTLTLPNYVHGRVLFTGDAAHLLPIFGVRGANTGLQDANNLAWKLAFVVQGWSDRALLESYSDERVEAAREICAEGGRSTRFMTPPSKGFRLMRDAALSFALSEDFLKDLLHWRTSRPHNYLTSHLNSFPEADRAFSGGIACGGPVRNVKLGEGDFLLDRVGAGMGFHLIAFAGDRRADEDLVRILDQAGRMEFPVVRVAVGARAAEIAADQAELAIADSWERVAAIYDAAPGTIYLLRPDLHVCARWRATNADEVTQALRNAAMTQQRLQP